MGCRLFSRRMSRGGGTRGGTSSVCQGCIACSSGPDLSLSFRYILAFGSICQALSGRQLACLHLTLDDESEGVAGLLNMIAKALGTHACLLHVVAPSGVLLRRSEPG